jgi:hypothetical protein
MSNKAITAKTKEIESVLRAKYVAKHPKAAVTVYRYNDWSIRVRIVDSDFKGKSIEDREKEVLPIIDGLSDYAQDRITMLLLLTPEESKRSLLSLEFDDPLPSSIR